MPWNRLRLEEEAAVLAASRDRPAWRSRQLAAWTTDHQGVAVSEATVHRLLRREGLLNQPEFRLLAGKEYQRKTWAPSRSSSASAPRRSSG